MNSDAEFTANMVKDYFDKININYFVYCNKKINANYTEGFLKTLKSKLSRYIA